MKTVLFICTGNTCRSPMAAALMNDLFARRGVSGFRAASAGLAVRPHDTLSENAEAVLKEAGVAVPGRAARQVSEKLIRESSFIVALAPEHRAALEAAFPQLRGKVRLLGGGVPDPYGGDIDSYRRCRDAMLPAVAGLAAELASDFEIVPMSAGHIAALAAIERECFTSPWSERSLGEELGNPLAVFRVAQADGEVVGYAGMTAVAGEGYIANIAVRAQYRHRGCARALLGSLCAYARENRLKLLTLEVRRSNAPAISLYSGAGFKTVGARPGFYQKPAEDALIMTKYFDTPGGSAARGQSTSGEK
jgi:ribosomal-protein-alanine N-acetyltransferase